MGVYVSMSNFRSDCSFPIDSGNNVSRLLWIASGSMVNLPSKFRVDSSAEGCPIDSGSCESVDSISDTFWKSVSVFICRSLGAWSGNCYSTEAPKKGWQLTNGHRQSSQLVPTGIQVSDRNWPIDSGSSVNWLSFKTAWLGISIAQWTLAVTLADCPIESGQVNFSEGSTIWWSCCPRSVPVGAWLLPLLPLKVGRVKDLAQSCYVSTGQTCKNAAEKG